MSHHGLPEYIIHRPAAYDFPVLDAAALNSLVSPPPDWIYFGTLQQLSPAAHQVLQTIFAAAPSARRCYDVNLRRDSHTPGLIQNLLSAADVLKLNEHEISEIAGLLPSTVDASRGNKGASNLEQFCRRVSLVFNLQAVCVTRGANGCALLLGDEYVTARAPSITVADTIGAGDAFCAALVHGISLSWPAIQIAGFASRVGALVASRYGGSPEWHPSEIAVMT
jgi:fructokinase